MRALRVATLETEMVDILRREIIRGHLSAGTQLRVRELAAQFTVSLTPVRNALARLEAEGYVTMSPRRGVQVNPLSEEDIEELVVMREALEGFAAEHAAAAITRPVIARMERLLAQQREALAIETTNPDLQIELDHDFHMALYESLERPSLTDKIEALRRRSMAYMYTAEWGTRLHEQRSVETHAALMRAVVRGDASTARRLIGEHIRNLHAAVVPLIGVTSTRRTPELKDSVR